MKKMFFLLYGICCYLAFFATVLYAIGFMGNVVAAKTMDSEPQAPLSNAIVVNACLLLLPVFQYGIMTRWSFKKWWVKLIPSPLERSTFILLVSVCILPVMWQWQPMGGIIWSVSDEAVKTILLVIYFSGWSIAFATTFLINHTDLFGLRQVWLYFTDRPYTPLPSFYKLVRHPLCFGFILALWSAPVMTAAHLLFSIWATAYMLVSMRFLPGLWNFLFGIPFLYRKE